MPIAIKRDTLSESLITSSSLTDIGDPIIFDGTDSMVKSLAVYITNTGRAFSNFALLAKAHPDADWETLLADTDWDAASDFVLAASANPKNLASGSDTMLILMVEGLYAVKFQCSISGGTVSKGTFTATGNATDADEAVVDTTTYIFDDTTLVDEPNHVLIGATASDTLDNWIAAMNGAAGEGTTYGTGTEALTRVTAAAGAGDTLIVSANADITAAVGTTIETTGTWTAAGSWGAATLADAVMTDVVIYSQAALER